MTFSPLVPTSTQSPKSQVTAIQTNFSQFATVFSALNNHVALNSAGQGNHGTMIFTIQTADPGIVENTAVVYAKNAPSKAGTQPQLFLQIPTFLPNSLDPSEPGNPGMQLTYNAVNTAGPVFQSFLPGGYLLYFGTITNPSTVTLSPAPTLIVSAIAMPNNTFSGLGTPDDVSTVIASNSTFQIKSINASPGDTFTWIALAQA
jgi:hypothetical protein